MKQDKFKQTIEVYALLGKKYIDDIEDNTPPEFYEFIQLLPKGGKVLEIGCTGGRDAKKFIQGGFQYTGIDVVDIFVKEAQKRVPKGKFIRMDVRHLSFPANTFDVVWANSVLVHLEKKEIPKTLEQIRRVLKKGGKLHIRVREGRGTKEIQEKLSAGKGRFFTYFQQEELDTFLKKAKLKIITSRIISSTTRKKDLNWISLWAEK